ncbi:MAG: hypothetical protein M1831_006706 [Alyxoria varia]|nr:MAG: hypothetical protein M1831_006706 [Alyxoria varia]
MDPPPLNLHDFVEGNEDKQGSFAQNLVQSLTDFGFVRIVGHGIGEKEVQEVFQHARKFFRMTPQEKAVAKNEPGPNPQRGWSRLGAENTASLFNAFAGADNNKSASELKDAREHWDQGPETDAEFPNRWPSEDKLPGFRGCMTTAMDQMAQVSDVLMLAIEVGLGLPPKSVLGRISKSKSASEFRLNHYPSVSDETLAEGYFSRIWPHFDLGVITLLFQDDVGGLEFEDRRQPGQFRQVARSEPTEMIVNVSETLQRWTNDRLPAGLHRVTPPCEKSVDRDGGMIPERFSVAYFCKADRDVSVAPLHQFVQGGAEQGKDKYSEMTALEYHQQRLSSAYQKSDE